MKQAPFVLVTLDYPPERGGVARYLGDLVEASRGELEVIVPETHAVSGPGRVQTRHLFVSGTWSWRPMITAMRRLRRDGYRHLFLSHVLPVGTAAWIACLSGGLPYTVLVHGLDIRLAAQRPHRRWLAGRVLAGAAHVVANSEAVAAEVRRCWPSIKSVEVITPAIAPRVFLGREEARAHLGIPADQKIMLTVARLVPRKGIDMAIRLLELYPDWRYVVIGSGTDEARLRELADAHAPGRVLFLPACEDAERDVWFAAADMFAFLARETSVDVEGFGIAPLEASQAGLPVLAGCSGGVGEAVLDQQTGILVDPENFASIREGFTRLAESADLRQQLGMAGAERVANEFTWAPRWERFRRLFSSI